MPPTHVFNRGCFQAYPGGNPEAEGMVFCLVSHLGPLSEKHKIAKVGAVCNRKKIYQILKTYNVWASY